MAEIKNKAGSKQKSNPVDPKIQDEGKFLCQWKLKSGNPGFQEQLYSVLSSFFTMKSSRGPIFVISTLLTDKDFWSFKGVHQL